MPDPNISESIRAKLSLVAPLSDDAFLRLSQHGQLKRWPKGAFLLREGERCNHIHFIIKGAVRAFQILDGTDINLHFYFENSFVTDLKSLRSATTSTDHLEAIEDLDTYTFTGADLIHLYKVSPEITLWGRNLLERLLIQQEAHAALFKLYSPAERYSWLLTNEPMFIQRLPLTQLASFLGMTRESLSRIRKRIK